MTGSRNDGTTVYPRVCGGTYRNPVDSPYTYGLSPRVRGNPAARNCHWQRVGSIPACAGEPAGSPD